MVDLHLVETRIWASTSRSSSLNAKLIRRRKKISAKCNFAERVSEIKLESVIQVSKCVSIPVTVEVEKNMLINCWIHSFFSFVTSEINAPLRFFVDS